jgi:predicted ribosome quality control (RQC) complex YloA/Tae2 family protein
VHNNYFFLKQLTDHLNIQIRDYVITACFSQNKDELIICLRQPHKEFWIRADLKRQFSCLSFPEQYTRAKKNSIDLFPEVIDRRIKGFIQYQHERAFSIILEEGYTLLFKLFGNFSNILLFKDARCTRVFKHGTGDEDNIDVQTLDRQINPILIGDEITPDTLRSRIPSFDKNIMAYLKSQGFMETISTEARYRLIVNTLTLLEQPTYYVGTVDNTLRLSLLPGDYDSKQFANPVDAINYFYSEFQNRAWLGQEKKWLIKTLNTQLKKTNNYIHKSKEKLNDLKKAAHYQQLGDIIMANLHNIRKGTESIELFDFYNHRPVHIKMKINLSPQKNAEQYYRKAKNQQIEMATLQKNIRLRADQSERISEYIKEIDKIGNLKELRHFADSKGLARKGKPRTAEPSRFHMYDHMGFRILVGKNARNNDELTFGYGYKEDLWLHAKDAKGSHVLIKYQAGKNFPKPVITMAARLAGYHSANRNMDTCPVIYTPRKYVRKSKGMPPGAVIVEREEIIFVKPAKK